MFGDPVTVTLTREQMSAVALALSLVDRDLAWGNDCHAAKAAIRAVLDNDKPVKPYTSGDLVKLTLAYKDYDPMRALATYASEDNWLHVHADQRHYWAWGGPVIVGYELAESVIPRAKK